MSEDGFPNAIKQATLAIVDDRTIKWENVPGLLTTSDSVLNLKFENILLPSLPHLPSGIMNMIGYMHFIIVRHDTGKFVDQFLGHTETFALTGETFAGHQLCQTPFSDTRIRLVGRNYASDYIGRLEMFKRGVWGTVGGRNFGNTEAQVACKQMGMNGGLFVSLNVDKYTTNDPAQPQWVYDVDCPSNEVSSYEKLNDCQTTWISNGMGDHNFDVVISCTSQAFMPRSAFVNAYSKIRLVDGISQNEGRVEIFKDGTWNSICGMSWDLNDAKVVCKELGYEDVEEAVIGGNKFKSGEGSIWRTHTRCTGNEGSLLECQVVSAFKCFPLSTCQL